MGRRVRRKVAAPAPQRPFPLAFARRSPVTWRAWCSHDAGHVRVAEPAAGDRHSERKSRHTPLVRKPDAGAESCGVRPEGEHRRLRRSPQLRVSADAPEGLASTFPLPPARHPGTRRDSRARLCPSVLCAVGEVTRSLSVFELRPPPMLKVDSLWFGTKHDFKIMSDNVPRYNFSFSLF